MIRILSIGNFFYSSEHFIKLNIPNDNAMRIWMIKGFI